MTKWYRLTTPHLTSSMFLIVELRLPCCENSYENVVMKTEKMKKFYKLPQSVRQRTFICTPHIFMWAHVVGVVVAIDGKKRILLDEKWKKTKLPAEKVTGQDFDRGKSLNVLHKTFVKALRMKKFLLVLDYVSFQNFLPLWHTFKSHFRWAKHGSEIILTTQNNQVARAMGNLLFYHLRTMSHEDSCRLFQRYAFKRYAFDDVNLGVHPELEIIGRQIVEKCQGLPLAVKLLGCLLSNHVKIYEKCKWDEVLCSNVDKWYLCIKENDIITALWRSYYYLPPHLKQCLAYCSIFPKGYEFDKEDLIKLWMAEDLLIPQNYMRMEYIGEKYFDNLLS
ncbi:putative disease resistance RPP13-like protein 1 [Ziziphus jujuba]|uniref:Disease resistance RPP13-like protein 1 n=1 Tax=Ziziphus jujuba TaxID=326968 RepID=A0ABM4A2B3_ZIZJJ|nr:putative disease resistance RPP13-like protein 1 [Ziziphus jujuba]